ncbi:hypothetical protein JCM8547_007171 [Rhodosporidiobolus lusitaniae]
MSNTSATARKTLLDLPVELLSRIATLTAGEGDSQERYGSFRGLSLTCARTREACMPLLFSNIDDKQAAKPFFESHILPTHGHLIVSFTKTDLRSLPPCTIALSRVKAIELAGYSGHYVVDLLAHCQGIEELHIGTISRRGAASVAERIEERTRLVQTICRLPALHTLGSSTEDLLEAFVAVLPSSLPPVRTLVLSLSDASFNPGAFIDLFSSTLTSLSFTLRVAEINTLTSQVDPTNALFPSPLPHLRRLTFAQSNLSKTYTIFSNFDALRTTPIADSLQHFALFRAKERTESGVLKREDGAALVALCAARRIVLDMNCLLTPLHAIQPKFSALARVLSTAQAKLDDAGEDETEVEYEKLETAMARLRELCEEEQYVTSATDVEAAHPRRFCTMRPTVREKLRALAGVLETLEEKRQRATVAGDEDGYTNLAVALQPLKELCEAEPPKEREDEWDDDGYGEEEEDPAVLEYEEELRAEKEAYWEEMRAEQEAYEAQYSEEERSSDAEPEEALGEQ